MPTSYLKKLAKLNHTTVNKIEKFWAQAKEIAKSEGNGKVWGLITTIFQNRLKKEGYKIKAIAYDSVNSPESTKKFYEDLEKELKEYRENKVVSDTDEYDDIDPLVGWNIAKAKISPSVQLVPVGLFSIIAPTILALGIKKSYDKQYAFFLVYRGQFEGSIGQFSLRPIDYTHIDDDEYNAKCEPSVWPPADVPPPSFVSAFIPDQAAHMCEVIRNDKHAELGEP